MDLRSRLAVVNCLAWFALVSIPVEARAADLVGKWLGQDGHDLVGGEPGPAKNDYQDVHIALKGLPPDRTLAEVEVRGKGGGAWISTHKGAATVLVVRAARSTSAELYIEPQQRELGREFEVKLTLDNGQKASIYIQGGKADPNVRAKGAESEAKWVGQDGHDRTGPGPAVGPDGFEDVHLTLSRLTPRLDIKRVAVTGPNGLAWESGHNPQGGPNAELIRLEDRTRADLFFSPSRDLTGLKLKVEITYVDDRGDVASLTASKCNPAKAMPRATAPTMLASNATARWLGQDGIETAPGDVHVLLEGLTPAHQIVAAALSDGVVATWVYHPNDRVKFDAGTSRERLQVRRLGPGKADLAFPPVRDESGTTMTLRLLDQSGREEILRFPGGPCDPDKRAPALPTGTVTARPGDDLYDLVHKFGTVRLAKGVYSLHRPLVLPRPVRVVGDPGAILRFSQGSDQSPWTAAIKIHAGGTTLEGFSVRFDGAIRWDHQVSFGPGVIASTDDRDHVPHDPMYRITLTGLDLQGSPATSDWEPAVSLVRLVSASTGRIEKNTLKGGPVVFAAGPWAVVDNIYKGALPGTFSTGVFSARYTHDLFLSGNKAKDEAPAGKTWRFLVLTQRGAFDRVIDNTVEGGIGPRADDFKPHDNAPEVILTEAYRLHFEGKPAAISSDGRVVTIPKPQGGGAGTGDSLAILSGPQAGQWRTVVQPLGPQTYLLDEPIPRETDAISLATGFVRETFQGNTVDCRGSEIAADLVLAGNLFGVKVARNRFLGGGGIRLLATPTEEPVHWGWSHAPFLGGLFQENVLEDATGGGLGVEHGLEAKTNRGRVYMSLTLKDNTIRWTRPTPSTGKPPRWQVGFPTSLDPAELMIEESGTRVEGADPGAVWVHAATLNGKVVREAPLKPSGAVGSRGAIKATSTRRD